MNFLVIITLLLHGSQSYSKDTNDALKIDWYERVTPEEVNISVLTPSKHLIEQHSIYNNHEENIILQGTDFSLEYPSAIAYQSSPGLVDTVLYSYKNHHNLIIRPDDVWTAIMIQFSLYVNANAEQLRHEFVNFEGKKNLEVNFTIPVNEVPIDVFINKILILINDNIDPSVSSWILPNFTTTTENDKLTAGAAMMSTFKKYFEYTLSSILCGIPEVVILGKLEDWIDIRKRVNRLKDFELNEKNNMKQWSEILGRILDEFVSVKEGKERNAKFWKEAVRVDYRWTHEGYFSTNKTYLNGWITAFSALDEDGRWENGPLESMNMWLENEPNVNQKVDNMWLSIATDRITPGVVQVPIKIKDDFAKPDEREYEGTIFAGHFGYAVQKDKMTLQPVSGWTMAITSNPPEYIRKSKLIK